MFRTPLFAVLTVALMGGTAYAAPANAPPSNLSDSARSAPDYDDDGPDGPPPPNYAQRAPQGQAANQADPRANEQQRDMFCRRDAAARTGYTTPRDAARDEQTRGTVGGTLGGAALGAVLGAAAGNAGLGAAAGAGAGLIAGTAIGADNARHAARDVEADYGQAYYACMNEADNGAPAGYYGNGAPRPGYAPGYAYDDGYAYGPPPPPYYYGAPYGYPYYPYYYGPSVSFGFGFGHGWHGGRGFHHR